ncbi:uncharacterized protein LOC114268305 isoform X3 [Camellia sinensis]|uniref:uncharacterized protein LOC114268305 isoform X3 n=1 Tax=Camellia sinensis TaxID=4442 RepID=UPI00103665C8|nr:uncharacterized protein LOC114268305 isoform X3 [Camellia sinensis]
MWVFLFLQNPPPLLLLRLKILMIKIRKPYLTPPGDQETLASWTQGKQKEYKENKKKRCKCVTQHTIGDELDDEVEPIDLWEEEDDAEPEIGDGGDGGGVVLQNCPWGERALSIAHEILLQFGDDMKLYAFKTTPRGYIYVRLDKLSNEYGCPSVEEIESYSHQYKKRLDEVGALGEIPDDLALECRAVTESSR